MCGRRWLEEFEQALQRENLPPESVRRLLEEMSDHVNDLMEENEHMDGNAELKTRLGEPAHVAATAGDELRSRSLLNRSRPAAFLTYVVLPLPLLAASWVLSLLCVGLSIEGLASWFGGPATAGTSGPVKEALALIAVLGCLLASAALVTWGYCKLSLRTGGRRAWMWSSVAILALVTGLADARVHLSEIPGQSTLTMGLGLLKPTPRNSVQFLVPVAVAGWLLRSDFRKRPRFA